MTGKVLVIMAALLAAAAWTAAQETPPASAPASQPASAAAEAAPDGEATVQVTEATGSVRRLGVAPDGSSSWVAVQAGDRLAEHDVLCTGFRSRVVLVFPDSAVVVIDRATKIGIAEYRRQGGAVRTAVGLKYGQVQAAVERAGGPNDVTVRTATAVAAVRGSTGAVGFTGDLGFQMRVRTGHFATRLGRHRQALVRGEGVDARMLPPADLKLVQFAARLADQFGGLSPTEQRFFLANDGGRGGIGFTPGGTGVNDVLPTSPSARPDSSPSPHGPVPPAPRPDIDVPGLDIDIGNP